MICSFCKKEGLKSKVYGSAGFITDMYSPPYFDEDGNRHHHDNNIRSSKHRCSNGHSWTQVSYGSCWCGWGKDREPKITKI